MCTHTCTSNKHDTHTQVYTRLNHLNMALSYRSVMRLVETISENHKVPMKDWIESGSVFKFVGDNVDKRRGVRNIRSDHIASWL